MDIQQIAGMQTGINKDLDNRPNNDQLREEIKRILNEEQQTQNLNSRQYNIQPTMYTPSIAKDRGGIIATTEHQAAKQEYLDRINNRNDIQANSGFISSQFSKDVQRILQNNPSNDFIRTPEEKMRQEQEAQAAMEQINQVRASNHSALMAMVR